MSKKFFKKHHLHLCRVITVRVNDMDLHEFIKPSAVLGYFQDIAKEHGELLGHGLENLPENNVWIILRSSYKVFSCPKINEKLYIVTFLDKPSAASVDRGYNIYNKKGELIIAGSTKWCLVNTKTQKIQRLGPVFHKYNDKSFIKITELDEPNRKIEALTDIEKSSATIYKTNVQLTEIDQNNHMNNACYADIILNTCGSEFLRTNKPVRIDINYIAQLFIYDDYQVHKIHRENHTVLEIIKKTETIASIRTEWEPG